MQARVSSQGRITLPKRLGRQLGLRPGDRLKVTYDPKQHQLELKVSPKPPKLVITTDPVTGWPVLDVEPGAEPAPVLTSEEVAAMLSDFP